MWHLKNFIANLNVVRPELSRTRKYNYCYSSFLSFFQHRLDTFRLLFRGNFNYEVSIQGKEILDEIYKQSGAIFITVHSGPYPLIGKIFYDQYSDRKLAVPFNHGRITLFHFLKRRFSPLGIELVALGGAMKIIEPVLSSGGSAMLFLDSALPVKHVEKVTIFGKKRVLTTGPLWLAKKYNLPIVPICTRKDKNTIRVNVFKPIEYLGESQKDVMDNITLVMENMINLTLDQWQVYDGFLHKN